tara:strand:+ start:217 stop:1341 length:1125 start_codon:yes stop_codon:yes gene_type:complete
METPMTKHSLLLSSVAALALATTAAYSESHVRLDANGNPVSGGASVSSDPLGGQIVVEQGDAEVDVTVPDPVVTVDQARPEVLVEQAQPEITVTVAEPTVTVEQQAPIITIEQAQPEVVVTIPEPTITVIMPEPNVNVDTAEPEIAVQQPEPIVRFVRPEPRITIEESEPRVEVTQAEPQIRLNRAEAAEIAIEQADANVNVQSEGEGEVVLSETDPVVNIEQSGQADVNVDQAEARVVIDGNADPAVTIDGTDGERAEAVSTDVQPPADPAASMFADVRVSDLVGMDVRGETGNEVGEIDSIVKGNDGLVAIVGVGGFLGLGEHEVAIALDRFERSDDVLILNALTESELEAMPAWDKSGEVQALDMMVGDIK